MNLALAIIVSKVNSYVIIALTIVLTLAYTYDMYTGLILGILLKLISKK